jgi:HD-GYP domain-containing protein (c-di-GMP phosphodiesterase class II)
MKTRVMPGDIVVGRPLTHNIYDGNGNLLLKCGYVLTSPPQIDNIVSRGAYINSRNPNPAIRAAVTNNSQDRVVNDSHLPESEPSFELIKQVYTGLEHFYSKVGHFNNFSSVIVRLSKLIQRTCHQDKDASLSTILVPYDIKYSVRHQVDTAIACELILKSLGYNSEDRLSIVAAALTMNIALIDLQDALYYQRKQLNTDQRIAIDSHVIRGMEMLGALGVTDKLWLNVILQHHEFMDGSGYPSGSKDEEIMEPSRILTIADIYCAKVTARAYRPPLPPHKAIREIYCRERGHCIDYALAKLFATEFGIYPPGSIVRLMNGDIAIVTHNNDRIDQPVAYSLVRPNGSTYLVPVRRDRCEGEFAIKSADCQSERISIDRYRLWCRNERM